MPIANNPVLRCDRAKLRAVPLICLFLILGASPSLHAQKDSSDKTGTNPINFTFDARFYNEYLWLDTAGDGWQNITTFEFRAPFAKGKWQLRTRLRGTGLQADFNDDGMDDFDEYGFGDMDIRFLTVPYLNIKKKTALAAGFEIFLPTGADDLLSSNAVSFGPQVFGVFFKPLGGFWDLIAPAYQHKFSVYEEDGAGDVHQGLIDLFFLKLSGDKKRWVLLDPQGVLDYENDRQFALFETELGTLLDKIHPGHSVYIRPSFGIGADRPYDFSLEVGYKIVW